MSGKIFISYRRDDSRYPTRMIYDACARGLLRENIFMDVDSIAPGVDFVRALERWVEQCEVFLVLMGPNWSGAIFAGLLKLRVRSLRTKMSLGEALPLA
jgi:hypothetical protein